MTDPIKRGRGAPKKAAADRHPRFQITLPPDLAAQLRSDPEGPSAAVARLLRAAAAAGR